MRPVKMKDLVHEDGYGEMLVVPSKVVPSVKAPDGSKKARISSLAFVCCGVVLLLWAHICGMPICAARSVVRCPRGTPKRFSYSRPFKNVRAPTTLFWRFALETL